MVVASQKKNVHWIVIQSNERTRTPLNILTRIVLNSFHWESIQIIWSTGFEIATKRKSFSSKLDCSDSGFALCAVLLSFSSWLFSFASHPKPASQVRGRAWAGQHLSRLDLLLFQRPGLPNNYDDNNDQNTIRYGIALPINYLHCLSAYTSYTIYTASYMHVWDGWMDGS